MTTATYATGLSTPIIGGTTGISNKHMPVCIQKFQYDVSTFTGTTAQSVALITIPARTMVLFLNVTTTALSYTNSPSFRVGDGTAYDTYVTADSTVTAHNATIAITTCPLKFYLTADKLNLTLTAGTVFPGTGVISFTLGWVDCSLDAPMTVQ